MHVLLHDLDPVSSCCLRSAPGCFLSEHDYSKHLLLCYICVRVISYPGLSITQYFLHCTACLCLLSVAPSPPPPPLLWIFVFLYLCLSPSLCFLSSPSHTHTLGVLLLWAASVCTEAVETTFFLFFSSHLAALYSNYPRRGLTAGNINRMARSDIEHTLMHGLHTRMQTHRTRCTHRASANRTVPPCHPPFYDTLLC